VKERRRERQRKRMDCMNKKGRESVDSTNKKGKERERKREREWAV
jgi:hypothetical protein